MNERLVNYLNQTKCSQETIEIATRSFLSELTDDLPPSGMKATLIKVAEDRSALENALLKLESSPQDRLDASLAILAWAWEDPENRSKIEAAFEGSQSKLPAIEAALLALIAMYGMYLRTTGGRKTEQRTIERKPDGTFKETTEIEYEGSTGPLSLVGKIFGSKEGPKSKT